MPCGLTANQLIFAHTYCYYSRGAFSFFFLHYLSSFLFFVHYLHFIQFLLFFRFTHPNKAGGILFALEQRNLNTRRNLNKTKRKTLHVLLTELLFSSFHSNKKKERKKHAHFPPFSLCHENDFSVNIFSLFIIFRLIVLETRMNSKKKRLDRNYAHYLFVKFLCVHSTDDVFIDSISFDLCIPLSLSLSVMHSLPAINHNNWKKQRRRIERIENKTKSKRICSILNQLLLLTSSSFVESNRSTPTLNRCWYNRTTLNWSDIEIHTTLIYSFILIVFSFDWVQAASHINCALRFLKERITIRCGYAFSWLSSYNKGDDKPMRVLNN